MREITSKDNNLIKYITKLQTSSKLRREDRRFVSEGLRVSLEALRGGVDIESVLITEDILKKHPEELDPLINCGAEVFLIPKHLKVLFAFLKPLTII